MPRASINLVRRRICRSALIALTAVLGILKPAPARADFAVYSDTVAGGWQAPRLETPAATATATASVTQTHATTPTAIRTATPPTGAIRSHVRHYSNAKPMDPVAATLTGASVRIEPTHMVAHRVRLRLSIDAPAQFTSLELTLGYDPRGLRWRRARSTASARHALMQAHELRPGMLRIALASANPMPSGAVLLLEFVVRDMRALAGMTLEQAEASQPEH